MSAEPVSNVIQFPKSENPHVELPDHVAKDMTGDPLRDLSKVLLCAWAAGSHTMIIMEREKDFKAKCRELKLDPDIVRKVTFDKSDPIDSAIHSLSNLDMMIKFAQRQCERLIESAATRAADPPPTPSRRRKRP